MNKLLNPGDVAHVPNFIDPKRAIKLGEAALKVIQSHRVHMVAELQNVSGERAPGISDITDKELTRIRNMAIHMLRLHDSIESRTTVTYQNGEGRRFAWHRDAVKDVRVIVNVGTELTHVLVAPNYDAPGEVYLSDEPDESDIVTIPLSPGDAYVLDNRTFGLTQMPHSTPLQNGRSMLRIDMFPTNDIPLELPENAEIVRRQP